MTKKPTQAEILLEVSRRAGASLLLLCRSDANTSAFCVAGRMSNPYSVTRLPPLLMTYESLIKPLYLLTSFCVPAFTSKLCFSTFPLRQPGWCSNGRVVSAPCYSSRGTCWPSCKWGLNRLGCVESRLATLFHRVLLAMETDMPQLQ